MWQGCSVWCLTITEATSRANWKLLIVHTNTLTSNFTQMWNASVFRTLLPKSHVNSEMVVVWIEIYLQLEFDMEMKYLWLVFNRWKKWCQSLFICILKSSHLLCTCLLKNDILAKQLCPVCSINQNSISEGLLLLYQSIVLPTMSSKKLEVNYQTYQILSNSLMSCHFMILWKWCCFKVRDIMVGTGNFIFHT